MTDFEEASRQWSQECDREAAELVRRGTPPREAWPQAEKIVSERRYRQAAEEDRSARLQQQFQTPEPS